MQTRARCATSMPAADVRTTNRKGRAGPSCSRACDADGGGGPRSQACDDDGCRQAHRGVAMSPVLSTDSATLPDLLRTRAAELSGAPFVRDANIEWSYGEFARRVTEIAAGLDGLGIARGDVVGVVLPNGPEYLEVWWAILWIGAVFNPVNPDLTGREATAILSDSGAVAVVCHEAFTADRRGSARRSARSARGRDGASRGRGPACGAARRRHGRRARRPWSPVTWPRSSTPPAPPAARRERCSRTATTSPTRACSPSRCRSGPATCSGWCCRCSTSTRRSSRRSCR